MQQVFQDAFGAEAFGTHAMCTWDAAAVVVVCVAQMALDGSRLLGQRVTTCYLVLGLLLGVDVMYPLFLAHITTARGPARDVGTHFRKYMCLMLVTMVPWVLALHQRLIVHGKDPDSLHDDMTSNPTAFRGMLMIMVLPFSHLAYLLPKFGEETLTLTLALALTLTPIGGDPGAPRRWLGVVPKIPSLERLPFPRRRRPRRVAGFPRAGVVAVAPWHREQRPASLAEA